MANLREDNVPNRGAVGRNRKKVKVFLEGKDDLAFLSLYWFPELKDRIDFRLAQEGPIPESGCNGVRKNVRFLREQGSSLAFGILDRDAIPDAIEACELDDHQFLNRNSEREPFIYYTLFWEIENYLIQAEPMEEERCDSSRDPEPCRPIAEVHQELREHCQTLIP